MAGLLGNNVLAIDMQNLQSDAGNYRLISFPNRVRITSVSFSVNQECMGAYEDERVWQIFCLIGQHTPTEGDPWNQWSSPIFGLSEKPTVTNARMFSSSVMENVPAMVSKPDEPFINLDIDYGVVEEYGFLVFWVQNSSGDISGIDWEDTAAVVNIEYEPTNKKSAREWFAIYPELD